jgi:hypothetical protein
MPDLKLGATKLDDVLIAFRGLGRDELGLFARS